MPSNALKIATELVKYYEGCRLDTYLDTTGHPTVGWGHLLSPKQITLPSVTQEQADQWLMDDLMVALNDVSNWVDLPINPCQEAALISLVYNVGITKFKKSRCLYWLNRARFDDCLKEWDFGANKRVNNGLGVFRRREAEKLIFKVNPSKTPDYLTIFNEAKKLGDRAYDLAGYGHTGAANDQNNPGEVSPSIS